MVVLLLVILVAILCFTHYSAYAFGTRLMDRLWFHRYYRPLVRRHARVVDRILEVTLEDNATAQQRNARLVAQNAVLRGKAIRHALNYREATRHLRRKVTPLQKIIWYMSAITDYQAQLDRLRRK